MKTLLFLLASVLVCPAVAQPPAPVGLELYSFRNQLQKDVPGTLAHVRALGFRQVEVPGTYGLTAAAFRLELDKYGLKAISMGAGFEELASNVPKIIDDAKALGVSYVVCFWISHTEGVFGQSDADRALDVFNTAGRLLADQNLKLCYHIHGYEFAPAVGFNGTFFDYLAANLNPRYVNFEMDVYWVKAPGQNPVELLKKYPRRFSLAHLKDRRPGTPPTNSGHQDVDTNVALGDGDIGIAEFISAARRAGVKHFFIEDESSRAMEQVPRSLAFLRSLK